MRHLILTRGAPGAGKSTFIDAQGLAPYTLSPDAFRLRFGGITMTPEGGLGLSHAHEKRVWAELEETLDFKMAQGQLVVVDATFQRAKDFATPLALARRHGYAAVCVDFSGVPKDVALERNQQRADWKIVPEKVIHTAYERFAAGSPPPEVELWPVDTLTGPNAVLDRLEPPLHDHSDFAAIVHIGDIQGCHTPVAKLFAEGWRDDTLYIFVGDLLDRGIENDKVIRWAMEELVPRENAVLLYGNHEYHLHRFALGLPPVSKEFEFDTLPQLRQVGFAREEAVRLIAKAVDVYAYRYRDRRMFVSHAGVQRVPDRLATLPSQVFWKGVGGYEAPVDKVFAKTMQGSDWLQAHGHRNIKKSPIQAAALSFNLEGRVEFGGALRVMTLRGRGGGADIETLEIENAVFRDPSTPRAPREPGVLDSDEKGKLSETALARLRDHPLVRAKSFATRPGVTSYNFTAKAFYDGQWDEVNTVARGLFVADDRRIVARSYPKFFNLDERAETKRKALRATLQYPLKLWVKENGFLGLLGWDHLQAEPLFCSKSTMQGDFAKWFREILEGDAGEKGMRAAIEAVRERNLTLVFEVNDPVRDPHMIAYDHPHVVLLDAVRREEAFSKLDIEPLRALAKALGVAVKAPGPSFKRWEDFEGWLRSVEAAGQHFMWKDKQIEGFVAEDARGFQFKIKLEFYAFWKRMRTVRDRVRRAREKGQEEPVAVKESLAAPFRDWLTAKPDAWLERDIIQLRDAYLAETSA